MSTVYLAWGSGAHETLVKHAADGAVDLLVAYPFLKQFLKLRKDYNVRKWVLDSGAFSVFNSGATVSLDDYVSACKDVDAAEVFGLDVIGDEDATRRNLELMWSEGIPAIPTYHLGEPESALLWCAANAPKIALGGRARGGVKRDEWVRQCFSRVWPKKIHGFAMASQQALAMAPFDSVDASSWIYAPSAMGCWAGYTGHQKRLKARGVKDFWIEVVEHQRRARWAEFRWRRELEKIK